MKTSLYYQHIISYSFDVFTAYYNNNNGQIMYVPNAMLKYLDEYYEINDFFCEPIVATGKSIITICINLTTKCNLRCKYCFNDKKTLLDLDINSAYNFINEIVGKNPQAAKFFIDLSGSGEPLLHMDKIIKIADYCEKVSNQVKKDIILQFATNGLLLNEKNVKILQNKRVLFGISIDGYKELHDENRVNINGNGSFDLIMKNYEKILHKEFIGAAMTLSNSNTDIFKAYQFLSSRFNTISIRLARQDYTSFDFSYILQGYKKVLNMMYGDIINQNDFNFLCKIVNGDDFLGKAIIKVMANSYSNKRCDAGEGRFTISANGKIYPCSAMVFDEQKKYTSKDLFENIISCSNCEILHNCGGICPIQANIGDVNKLCYFKKEIFKYVIDFCGHVFIADINKYQKMLEIIGDVLKRNYEDIELLEVLDKCGDRYTYTELKLLKYNDNDKYMKLKFE